tara:strand:- start:32 stop:280 length:249 start_codon:yes stop_codon:yes gene_type:complete
MPVQRKAPISVEQLAKLDRMIATAERARGGRGHQGVRQDLAKALLLAPSQLSRVFSEMRVPRAWASATAFTAAVQEVLDGLE